MKLIARILLIGAGGFFISTYFPWWAIAPWTFLVAFLLHGNNFASFLSGFLGVGLLWLGYSWKLDQDTNSILSEALLPILKVVPDSLFVVLITGLVGALLGGFSAVSGNSFRQIFVKKRRSGLYH